MRLDVWLDGTLVGVLERTRGQLRFTHGAGAFALGVGRPVVSVSMPVRRAPYVGAVVAAFFDGLLPEGDALRIIAYDRGVARDDALALLDALGRDCAGALQLLPAGAAPSQPASAMEVLGEHEVAERLRRLATFPLGVDERVRISLAGVQEKLVLAQAGDGWALPLDGTPSTHILKPAHRLLPAALENEALCLAIARECGLPVAAATIETFADRQALVVERYDRTGDVPARRIHQEDMCQATGRSPRAKYEEDGGPGLRDCARLIVQWGDEADLLRLLDLTTLNVAIGNADAHGKNISLMHTDGGRIQLAPAYDLLCTRLYEDADRTLGMFVNGVCDIDKVSATDILAEALSWGIPEETAADRITQMLDRLPDAIDRAAASIDPPRDIVELIQRRVTAMGAVVG